MEVREMTAGDVPAVARAAAEAGWPNKERQFAFFVRHPDGHAVVARAGEEIAGAACGFAHGRVGGVANCGANCGANGEAGGRTGWLGLIFTSGARRRRGLGTSLTRAAMERLREAGCRTLLLVATDPGRPLYERLGFETETLYHGFAAPGLPAAPPDAEHLRPAAEGDRPAVLALDRWATGEDRSGLLGAFPAAWLSADPGGGVLGYHAPAPWGGGPTIARDVGAGLALLERQRRRVGAGGVVRAWLARENAEGREAVGRAGFRELGRLPRMVLGEPPGWRPEALWGVFSLAKG